MDRRVIVVAVVVAGAVAVAVVVARVERADGVITVVATAGPAREAVAVAIDAVEAIAVLIDAVAHVVISLRMHRGIRVVAVALFSAEAVVVHVVVEGRPAGVAHLGVGGVRW